jgi:site-specific recombinase XerD
LIPLPGLPGSPEFNAAYEQAVADNPHVEIAARRTRAGSINAAIIGYTGSAAFQNLAPASQIKYRRVFEGLRQRYGDMSVSTLERKHVVRMLDAKAKAPAAARDLLVCLRLLVRYAVGIGIRQDDPTAGVRVKLPHSDGYHSWTEAEITAFQNAYPIGGKPRLAIELLLGTALRCEDVVKVGRGHVRNGMLTVPVTQKTKAPVIVPVTAELAAAIDAAAPADHMLYLLNEHGRPFTAKTFGKWLRHRFATPECEDVGGAIAPHQADIVGPQRR